MAEVRRENKRQRAVKLRLEGKSYGEIMKSLGISSKGTLSGWFRELELSDVAKERLKDKLELARKRNLFDSNKRRTKNIKAENKKIFEDGINSISALGQKEIMLIGAALYWGEGTTRERLYGYQTVSFSNSDPRMIRVFMEYLKYLDVSNERIRASIQIHPNLEAGMAKSFWAGITRLPVDRFNTYLAISSASKRKRPQNFLPYGTLNLRVNDRRLFCRIKGHIEGIVKQLK